MVFVKTKSPWLKDIKIKAVDIVDKEFLGNTPPTVFVGSRYMESKKANVGVLSPLEEKENAWKYDDPYYWYENDYDIKRIVNLRANLINARKQTSIFDVRTSNRFLELAQEIAMSRKTTSIEVELKKRLNASLNFDEIHLPFGPSGEVNRMQANENIKLDQNVERVFYDADLKAADALRILHNKGLYEYQLSQLFSMGVMGLKYNRKLVPTKWSITATDDIIGNEYIEEIRKYPIIENCRTYFGNYFGNYYLILLFPDVWGYELFESALPDRLENPDQNIYTTTDYEDYHGRKNYASNTVGGYYAARLALLEELRRLKRQGSCLVLRYVTSEYSVPLGVFVVRQAVRKTVKSLSFRFEERKSMINFARGVILRKFGYNINAQLKQSISKLSFEAIPIAASCGALRLDKVD